MLVIAVELLHGSIRAGSPDDLALSGREDPGEWPPSPARLFAALVAADGTRARMRFTDGSELRVLERARPPVVYADRREDVVVSQQLPRYVVRDAQVEGATQEYPARKNTLVRPSPRLSPREASVVFAWPDLRPSDAVLQGLRRRAARVGYLGCADSPVRLRVHRCRDLGDFSGRPCWEPDDRGTAVMPVPFAGLLDVLDRMYDDFTGGQVPRRSWYATRLQRYRPPAAHAHDDPVRVTIWLRFEWAVTGRHVLAITQALRDATLASYERHVVGARDAVPAILHGHGFTGTGYDHASWLALPDVGHAHATGRLHGAAVMLPDTAPADVVDGVRTALWHVSSLRIRGGRRVPFTFHQGERRPWAANPRRWTGPARRWTSALPVVHERWSRRPPDLEEIRRWCRHAGVRADVVRARLSRPPLVAGGVSLMPHEATRPGSPSRPYSHLEVEFSRDVCGPLVLGRQRHFGLGLMVPHSESERPAHGGQP